MKQQQETYYLPKGWKLARLDDVAVIVTGNTPPTNIRAYFNGDIPFYKPSDLNEDYIKESRDTLSELGKEFSRILPKNSILITCIGSLGKSGIISKEGAFNQQINGVLPILSNTLFFYYQIISQQFQNLIRSNASATTVAILNKSKLGNLPFLIAPLDEQNLIATQIDLLFGKLNEAEKGLRTANSSLKIYRQSLLKNAFEGVLTKNWRRDLSVDAYQELTNIQKKRKDKFHAELESKKGKKIKIDFEFDYKRDNKISSWAISSLDNLIDINARIGWRGLTKKEYTNEGALFLSVHSLNYGKNVVFKDANFISIERYNESPEIQLKENDILLCKDGAGIGKVGIVKKLPDKATVNSSLLVIDAREVFNPDFLYYFFLGPDMQRLVNEKISGTAIPHLFQKDIKKFKLKVPPILEQDKIVEILESRFTLVDNLEKTIDNVLNEIIALKHSILKKAFEGRLVSYTSNESVENLLNDIQEVKRLYLENQKELTRSKPKQKKKMEEKKSILDILKKSDSPISAQELWEKSTSEGDIERFYSEIKEIYHQIDELKSKTESLLSLKDENK